jgi:hypothetical protein
MQKKILSVFGDESFPRTGVGSLPTKRQVATDNIMMFFKSLAPDLVYIVPNGGTCIYTAAVCKMMNIPYILVCPYPGYFENLAAVDATLLARVLDAAKTLIILNENPVDKNQAKEEANQFLATVGTFMVFLYNSDSEDGFQDFMDEQCEKYIGSKILMELAYNERQVFG